MQERSILRTPGDIVEKVLLLLLEIYPAEACIVRLVSHQAKSVVDSHLRQNKESYFLLGLVIRLQRLWRACVSNPYHPVGRRRLIREWRDINWLN